MVTTLEMPRAAGAEIGGRAVRLTERELAVLRLRSDGLGTGEIAAALGVSPDEVAEHLAAAMRKLGAASPMYALILAHRAGLIEPPE
jgi:DNA-binding CsgD family transcriptional regulator